MRREFAPILERIAKTGPEKFAGKALDGGDVASSSHPQFLLLGASPYTVRRGTTIFTHGSDSRAESRLVALPEMFVLEPTFPIWALIKRRLICPVRRYWFSRFISHPMHTDSATITMLNTPTTKTKNPISWPSRNSGI